MLYNLIWKYGDYMKNKKGFILTETLVVIVFLVTIATFVYVSVVPLMGRYEDLIDRERDIDIVYKLYNIRKLLLKDDNKEVITGGNFNGNITCNSFSNSIYCNKLVEQMELKNFRLMYINNIYNNIANIKSVDTSLNTTEFYRYLRNYQNDEGEYLVLLDLDRHTIAHLMYAPFIQTY